MGGASWNILHRQWPRFQPPLAPHPDVAARVGAAIAGHDGNVLLLGVTPLFCGLGKNLTALDLSADMIAHVWPGDTPQRRAVQGSWLAMPPERGFTAVIGDGSLNVMPGHDHSRLMAKLERVLLPGARLAIRVYVRPDTCESVAALRAQTLAGQVGGFHAFKMRLAMAIAAEQGDMDMPVERIHRIFEREFPDRAALGRAAGWSADDIGEIDAYAGAASVYSFPLRDEISALLPGNFKNMRLLPSGRYPVAERCPILVADLLA